MYRTHDAPDEDKIKALAAFINNFGYSMHIGTNEMRPKEIQKLLTKIEDTPEEALISRLALRSMKRAGYSSRMIFAGKHRPFRACRDLLYAFHIPYPAVSGPSDPPNHQGQFERPHE